MTIACTGLLYTLVWGAGYKPAARSSSLAPVKSVSNANAPALPLDDALSIAREYYPGAELQLTMNARAGNALFFSARGERAPREQGTVALDRSTGAVLQYRPISETPTLTWCRSWNYPLHVGSVLGTPTKVLWLVACLVLMAMPVTGLWMWWQRRPPGRTGFPRRPHAAVPHWLVGAIVLIATTTPLTRRSR